MPRHVSVLCGEKVEYLTELGIDYIAVAKFDNHFRSLSAEAFAHLLKNSLNATHLVLGDDFHFGKNRQGNSEFLRNYGFQVTNLSTIKLIGERVSSTRIRQTLQAGDLALAATTARDAHIVLLDASNMAIKLVAPLDFPTINVRLNRHKPCLNGIYGVEVLCETDSLNDKVKQDILTKRVLQATAQTALFGAGHVRYAPSHPTSTARMAI